MKKVNLSAAVSDIKNKLNAASPNGKYTGIISQSLLRAEVETVNAQGIYTFDFKKQKNSPTATESPFLLKDNDMFKAYWLKFYIGARNSTNPAIFVKQTYPNDTGIPTDTAGTMDKTHLEALYNAGYLSYKKGDTTFLPALSLTDARFVGQTQQSAATNRTSTELGEGGAIGLVRPVTMIGTDVGEWILTIPAAQNLIIQYTALANTKLVLILELHGILCSGGNKIATASQNVLGE